MQEFLQQLVNGLTMGSVYALVALGYTMVYGILKLINFAHGELFMLGGFFGLTWLTASAFSGLLKSPLLGLLVLFLLVMAMVAVIGVLLDRVAYKPLRRSPRLAAVVSALGASIFLQNAVMLVFGSGYLVFPDVARDIYWMVGGVKITLMRVIIFLVAVCFMVGLYLLVQKTQLGAAMRAASLDHDTSRLMGIDVDKIIMLVFVIGPALGAAAGLMVGLYYRQINFAMGWTYGIRAFTAAIMGGIGNIPGAMIGGLLLGIIETLGAGYISATWKDAISFAILIFILIWRPTGLLGERVADKV